jgi:hypothetical protein
MCSSSSSAPKYVLTGSYLELPYGLLTCFLQERIANIQEEMFFAARGKYMELVSGRRAAEDDEHTEVSCTQSYLSLDLN